MTVTPRTLRTAGIALAIAMTAAVPFIATASDETPVSEADRDRIAEAVAAEGYALVEIEQEDGTFEVEATKDGTLYELYVDPASGKILKAELED